MAEQTRYNPYKNFRFQVSWDTNIPVAGISKMSPLKRTTATVEQNAAGLLHSVKDPGITKFEPITLERGVTLDKTFHEWAKLVCDPADAARATIYRKDITISLLSDEGKPAKNYHLFRCWPSEYQALPDCDSMGNAVAIEHLKVEMDYWELEEVTA